MKRLQRGKGKREEAGRAVQLPRLQPLCLKLLIILINKY